MTVTRDTKPVKPVKPFAKPTRPSGGGGAGTVYEGNGTAYVDFGANSFTQADTDAVTITCEVYIISHTAAVRGLVGFAESFVDVAANTNFTLTVHSDNRARLRWNDGGSALDSAFSSAALSTGAWLSVEATFDGANTITVEVDSVAGTPATVASPTAVDTTPRAWILGSATNGQSDNLQIRNVQVVVGGATQMNCPCDEGSGTTCINNGTKGNGTISDATIHATPL